jgi:hypothetical protein
MRQVGGEKRIPTTTPSSPYLEGTEGSRSHHWLPRPCWVPVFHRAGFIASTL